MNKSSGLFILVPSTGELWPQDYCWVYYRKAVESITHTRSWLGFCKKPQQYTMDLHVMVTCPVLLFLTCFVTFMSYLAIFIFVFGIFGRMNSRIIRCIKGAWDPSKPSSNQSGSKQQALDRTGTHRTCKSNRLNTRSLGYLCEHRLRNTNTHSKSTPYSI